ncbi:hypothetical protein RB11810 [Rhodopirellula baltica SH 1]|uniref:Uncharacterized protein n=1 Tax=Rhodopirellula baltica (strain DSM 10527 / NCIMB 13988 / SH1) TaxID=243090 RepID=Q7UJL9_RHOBA|nr:hypothetical protein RB11810 [Rhodopirellula baltica SH 1]
MLLATPSSLHSKRASYPAASARPPRIRFSHREHRVHREPTELNQKFTINQEHLRALGSSIPDCTEFLEIWRRISQPHSRVGL